MRKQRIDQHQYFMLLALMASARSTCLRRQVGCVAVKDKRILATGYNGSVSGTSHCEKCWREENNIPSGEMLDMCFAVHAEQNVICQAAIHGVSISGCDIYVTCPPCATCMKLLAQINVKNIYCLGTYPASPIAEDICRQKNIRLNTMNSIDPDIVVNILAKQKN